MKYKVRNMPKATMQDSKAEKETFYHEYNAALF